MRSMWMAAVAGWLVATALVQPARAADLEKYLPDDTTGVLSIKVQKVMTAPMIRKVVPMAFDKYGDQIVPLVQMAQQLAPQAKDLNLDDVAKAIKAMKDPKAIADGLDAAKEFAPEILLAGDSDDPSTLLLLVKIDGLKAETVEAMTGFANQVPGLKLEKKQKGKLTVYKLEMKDQDQELHVTIPEDGLMALALDGDIIDQVVKSAEGKRKPKLTPEFKKLFAQKKSEDFIFMASIEGEDDDLVQQVGHIVVDQDLSWSIINTYATEAKAKEGADEIKETIGTGVEGLKEVATNVPEMKSLLAIIKKVKPEQTGKVMKIEGKLTTAEVEKMLAK